MLVFLPDPWLGTASKGGQRSGPRITFAPAFGKLVHLLDDTGPTYIFGLCLKTVLDHGISLKDIKSFVGTKTGLQQLEDSPRVKLEPGCTAWVPPGMVAIMCAANSSEHSHMIMQGVWSKEFLSHVDPIAFDAATKWVQADIQKLKGGSDAWQKYADEFSNHAKRA